MTRDEYLAKLTQRRMDHLGVDVAELAADLFAELTQCEVCHGDQEAGTVTECPWCDGTGSMIGKAMPYRRSLPFPHDDAPTVKLPRPKKM